MANELNEALKALSRELGGEKYRVLAQFLFELSMHDPKTLEHSARVGLLAYRAARELGQMRETKLDPKTMLTAGLGHDLGKLEVDRYILTKDSKPTEEEWKQLHRHPEGSYHLLKDISEEAAEVARRHHHYQKNAYPRKMPQDLKRDYGRITNMAATLGVLDKYDAYMSRDDGVEKEGSVRDYLYGATQRDGRNDRDIVDALFQKGILSDYSAMAGSLYST